MMQQDRNMTARVSKITRLPALVGLLASLATLGVGCKQPVLCAPLDSCGGSLVAPDGTQAAWVLDDNHVSCMEDLYEPGKDTRLTMGEVTASQKPYPEPALYDWCVLLVTGPGL